MAKTQRTLIRERRRLMRPQNPGQIDYRRMKAQRRIRTLYWKLMKKTHAAETQPKKEKKEKRPAPKKVEEPELEELEEEEFNETFFGDDENEDESLE